jgi:transposase
MKALTLGNREEMVFALQDEIRRTSEARYDHRLHAVLLVAQGMSCRQTAAVLGDAPRSVEYWVHRFDRNGFGGLSEGDRPGRPSRLSASEREQVEKALRGRPSDVGLPAQLWDGPLLSAFLKQELGVSLRVRQCQRLFRQFGFRLRKPRPLIASADPLLQAAHKKTPASGRRSGRRPLGAG